MPLPLRHKTDCMAIQQVAVIGAGTMGNGIAHVFAQTGFKVTLVDVQEKQLERALATITKKSITPL